MIDLAIAFIIGGASGVAVSAMAFEMIRIDIDLRRLHDGFMQAMRAEQLRHRTLRSVVTPRIHDTFTPLAGKEHSL